MAQCAFQTAIGDRSNAIGNLAEGILHTAGVKALTRSGGGHGSGSIGSDIACLFDALGSGFASLVFERFTARTEQLILGFGRRYRGCDERANRGANACNQKRVFVDEIRYGGEPPLRVSSAGRI